MRHISQALWALIVLVAWVLAVPAHAAPPAELAASEDEPVVVGTTVTARPWDLPNQCERIDRKVWSKKRERYYYKRARHKYTHEDRKRVRAVIKLVADEMGADHRYLWAKSIIESSGNPETIHILNADFEANRVTWHRFTYSERREKQLLDLKEKYGAQSKVFWRAKADLHRIRKYKGNQYWDETQEVQVYGPKDHRSTETPSIWSWGYGLYGMNSVYYTEDWDNQAPPWILCAEDGLIATVIEIWALRHGIQECVAQGYENNWDTANRRVSRGKCDEHTPGKKYVHWAAQMGLERDKAPKLGTKWDRKTSDRQQLLDHMRKRIVEECLTPELYQRSACTNEKARGYSNNPVDADQAESEVEASPPGSS